MRRRALNPPKKVSAYPGIRHGLKRTPVGFWANRLPLHILRDEFAEAEQFITRTAAVGNPLTVCAASLLRQDMTLTDMLRGRTRPERLRSALGAKNKVIERLDFFLGWNKCTKNHKKKNEPGVPSQIAILPGMEYFSGTGAVRRCIARHLPSARGRS